MNLEQSVVLVDRALVTLCAELPESLGLYNTAKDEFTLGALRSIPMLETLLPESRKHHIIRDWMRTYEEHEDQALSSEVNFVTLRGIVKKERKQRAKEAKERNAELLSDDDGKAAKEKVDKAKARAKAKAAKANAIGNGKAKAKTMDAVAAAKRKAELKAKRKARREEDVPSDSDASTSSTPSSDALDDVLSSSSSESSSSSDGSSSDDDRPRRSKSKGKNRGSKAKPQSKTKGKQKRNSAAKDKTPRKTSSSKSNLPPIEVVLSSDEDDDEPDALFDADDPDVYEVETILDKRPGQFGESDKYLIKWVGYEETTWEPAENVSKDLIDEFDGQSVRENEFVVEEILDRKAVRDKQTKLKTFKYLVKWVGYEDTTWEPAENLPHNLRRKFDTKYEARKRRRMS